MDTATKPCLIEGCNKNAHHLSGGRKGLCRTHAKRMSRHGDPLRGRTPNGDPDRYLERLLSSAWPEECVVWPFSRSPAGYGMISRDGRPTVVSRVVCETVNGPPAEAGLQAAHNCGNGGGGCCNPKHLRWATAQENSEDALLHGTRAAGERHGNSRLTWERVRWIRANAEFKTLTEMAARLGVGIATVHSVVNGNTWREKSTSGAAMGAVQLLSKSLLPGRKA